MQELFKLAHSAHHLMVFEVAARYKSFTRAAGELNVSQPAVSLAIRQLEQALGVSLFVREYRCVRLTQAGEIFYQDVSEGFGRMLKTAQLLQSKKQKDHVTLSTSTAFANYWMVPRLSQLHGSFPDIDLRLQTTDRDINLIEEGVSLGIRRGNGKWQGYNSKLIAAEILYPVASPRFEFQALADQKIEVLASDNLIHLEEPFRPRPSWKEWFSKLNVKYTDEGKGLRLNDYALVIQASMAGEGIAMGWHHVVEPLLHQGLLCQIGNWKVDTGYGFYLIWSQNTQLSTHATQVKDWIIATTKV